MLSDLFSNLTRDTGLKFKSVKVDTDYKNLTKILKTCSNIYKTTKSILFYMHDERTNLIEYILYGMIMNISIHKEYSKHLEICKQFLIPFDDNCTCMICLENMLRDDVDVECDWCHKTLHYPCMLNLIYTEGQGLECPCCRYCGFLPILLLELIMEPDDEESKYEHQVFAACKIEEFIDKYKNDIDKINFMIYSLWWNLKDFGVNIIASELYEILDHNKIDGSMFSTLGLK